MTLTTVKLPQEFNIEHPKTDEERALLRKALSEIINSRRIGSTGHISRWIVGPFAELESSWGRLVRA